MKIVNRMLLFASFVRKRETTLVFSTRSQRRTKAKKMTKRKSKLLPRTKEKIKLLNVPQPTVPSTSIPNVLKSMM